MADLSPAARAVLDAFHKELPPDNQPGGLSAALRAVADLGIFADTAVDQTEIVVLVSDLLAIANELDPTEPHLAAPLSRL
jgi:hypothetical protein